MDEFDIHFPFAGIDRTAPFCRQPAKRVGGESDYARTSYFGKNVRGYDSVNRLRGGSRPGLTKYLDARPEDTRWVTQFIGQLTVMGLDDPGGGDVQPSQSGRLVMLVVVSQGNVYTCPAGGATWTIATNNTGFDPPLNITGLVRGTTLNQKLFFADGVNQVYYDPQTNTVQNWLPSVGDFPVDSEGNLPRLICTWRARIVQAALLKDSANWFMTKVSNPFDMDVAPDTLPVPTDSAVAGNAAPQGKAADEITALIPYSDDTLILGMNASIAIFRGDPAAGGKIDLLTSSTGIAFGEAWAMDDEGVVYFFSSRCGVYKMQPQSSGGASAPTRISTAIDSILEDVNTGEYGIRLLWNDKRQGLHVFVTLLSNPFTAQHYFWEKRTNAWWVDTFTDPDHNPLCCCVFDGNLQDDRVALIGSWDGYVRSVSTDATDDDGQDIESEVWIGALLTREADKVLLRDIQGIMAEDSEDVFYDIHVGDTAEQALASASVASGTWHSARNRNDGVRRSGHAAYVKITGSLPWALESIRGSIETKGKVNQRRGPSSA